MAVCSTPSPSASAEEALRARDRRAHRPEAAAYVEENCTGELLSYQQIAADGLTMRQALPTPTSTLQPGYRYDALVVFPEAGDYCVVNKSAPRSRQREPRGRHAAAFGRGPGRPGNAGDQQHGLACRSCCRSVALQTLPPDVRDKVAGEIRDGLKFTSFIPHPDIAESEVTGKQELVFFINITNNDVKFEVGNKSIDPQHFDPAQFNPQPTIRPGSTVS